MRDSQLILIGGDKLSRFTQHITKNYTMFHFKCSRYLDFLVKSEKRV